MNRPGPFTYFIGNPISVLALFALTAWLAYQWYSGAASGFLPLVTGGVALAANNARERLEKYRQWNREWDSMGGARSSNPLGAVLRNPNAKPMIGVALWLIFAFGLIAMADSPEKRVAIVLFALGTLVLIGGALYRLARRNRVSSTKAKEVGDLPVTQCMRTPSQSPSVQQAFAALPPYCRSLFG